MAFTGNDSSKEVINEFKLYTGIQAMKPIAINPNLEELHKLGIKFKTEPKYIQEPDDKGNKRVMINIYVQVDKILGLVPLTFYLTNTLDYSENKGTYRFLDKNGKHGWDTEEGKCSKWDWVDETSVRKALKGEASLHDFFTNYLSTQKGDICRLETPEKIFEEDYSELRSILEIKPENKFKGLLYVSHADNGKSYQKIYSQHFNRANSTSITYWEKHINRQIAAGYPIKGTYSYTFQEYTPVEPSTDIKITDDINTTDTPLF